MREGTPYLSLVVPAFDEIGIIRRPVEIATAFLDDQAFSSEFIVIDDSGRRAPVDEVSAGAARWPSVRVLVNERNCGTGYSVRRGMLASSGVAAAFLDADLAQPVGALPSFLAAIDREADVALGRRRAPEGTSVVRRLASASFGVLARSVLGLPFRDTQCGMKAFRGDAARRLFAAQRVDGFAFDAELLAIAFRWGLRVEEVPIDIEVRSTSTVRLAHDGRRMLGDLLRVRSAIARGDYDRPRQYASRSSTV